MLKEEEEESKKKDSTGVGATNGASVFEAEEIKKSYKASMFLSQFQLQLTTLVGTQISSW